MQEKNMRFGDYIKKKRMDDPREVTLSDMSKQLGISISFLSDIENKRRSPFGADKIEKFAAYLELSDGDKAFTYDLASRERREIPSDIEDVFMYKDAIMEAMFRGTKRNIESEPDPKNAGAE